MKLRFISLKNGNMEYRVIKEGLVAVGEIDRDNTSLARNFLEAEMVFMVYEIYVEELDRKPRLLSRGRSSSIQNTSTFSNRTFQGAVVHRVFDKKDFHGGTTALLDRVL